MSPLGLAWRGLVRQPARAVLGVLGVAAVAALLFDMLMLSRGLVLSFHDLLEQIGFDVRVTATRSAPFNGPRIENASLAARTLRGLPEVDDVVPVGLGTAVVGSGQDSYPVVLMGVGLGENHRSIWSIVDGDSPYSAGSLEEPALLVNPTLAGSMGLVPGDAVSLVGTCDAGRAPLPPSEIRVAGIAEFPFDSTWQLTVAMRLVDMEQLCGETGRDEAGLLLVASAAGIDADRAVEAILEARPDVHAFSNRQLLHRFRTQDFSYFRQISFVLSSITLFFAFLLITSLLTVSVNQRFAEVAALRALGFSRRRIVLDLLCESALLVGTGGLLALPLGGLLAAWLDRILRSMPGIPARLHFFVFEPRTLAIHLALIAVTGLLAAAYPMLLAARLPIAATLRREVVS